jgi:hypothetical protein
MRISRLAAPTDDPDVAAALAEYLSAAVAEQPRRGLYLTGTELLVDGAFTAP